MSRFDEPIKMKLGDILKTFTTSTYALETNVQSAMADATAIWDLLGISEEEYYVKYPSVDLSGITIEDLSGNAVTDVSGDKITNTGH
jgi:hypothetical protein